jgi:hypothetical protein
VAQPAPPAVSLLLPVAILRFKEGTELREGYRKRRDAEGFHGELAEALFDALQFDFPRRDVHP